MWPRPFSGAWPGCRPAGPREPPAPDPSCPGPGLGGRAFLPCPGPPSVWQLLAPLGQASPIYGFFTGWFNFLVNRDPRGLSIAGNTGGRKAGASSRLSHLSCTVAGVPSTVAWGLRVEPARSPWGLPGWLIFSVKLWVWIPTDAPGTGDLEPHVPRAGPPSPLVTSCCSEVRVLPDHGPSAVETKRPSPQDPSGCPSAAPPGPRRPAPP